MESPQDSRVIVISLRKAQLVIGKPYLSKQHLAWLFEIEDPESVVLLVWTDLRLPLIHSKDPEAEEVDCDENGQFMCDITKHYTIVREQDIDDEDDPNFTEAECFAHIARVDERRKDFILLNWRPKHAWLYAEDIDVLVPKVRLFC